MKSRELDAKQTNSRMRAMDQNLLDLYSGYLIALFSLVTATGLSDLVDGRYSHDQITRLLGYSKKRQMANR